MFISLLVFFSGMLSLILVRKHYFLCLLSIEFLFISLFYFLFYFFGYFFFDYFFCILFLILGVCDSVIGLSILVFLIRKLSNDYCFSLIMC